MAGGHKGQTLLGKIVQTDVQFDAAVGAVHETGWKCLEGVAVLENHLVPLRRRLYRRVLHY